MMESEPKHNFPWQEMDSGEPYLVFKNNGNEFIVHRENTMMYLFPEYPQADHIWISLGDYPDGREKGMRIWRSILDEIGDGVFNSLCDQMYDRGFDMADDEEPSPLDVKAYEEKYGEPLHKNGTIDQIVHLAMKNFDAEWAYIASE